MITAIRKRLEGREEGFTLIELLVVVIIIGILAAIAIPTFLNQRQRGWNAAAQASLRNAAIAQESYQTEESTYIPDDAATEIGLLEAEGWNASDNVVLDVLSGSASAYCMSAKHDSSDDTYFLSSGGGAPTTTTCVTP